DDRRLRAAERELVRFQGDAETAEVADVLTDGEGAVDVVLLTEAEGHECVVLRDESLRALLERGTVLVRPPVLQASVAVVAAALVVEAVADLVADDRAD